MVNPSVNLGLDVYEPCFYSDKYGTQLNSKSKLLFIVFPAVSIAVTSQIVAIPIVLTTHIHMRLKKFLVPLGETDTSLTSSIAGHTTIKYKNNIS